jgi:hypothetical protein
MCNNFHGMVGYFFNISSPAQPLGKNLFEQKLMKSFRAEAYEI